MAVQLTKDLETVAAETFINLLFAAPPRRRENHFFQAYLARLSKCASQPNERESRGGAAKNKTDHPCFELDAESLAEAG